MKMLTSFAHFTLRMKCICQGICISEQSVWLEAAWRYYPSEIHVSSLCSSALKETWKLSNISMSSIHLSRESAPYLCGKEGVWVMGAEKEEGIEGRYGGSGKKILSGVFFW